MKILVIGSGGREHAICQKIIQSPLCSKLFVAKGNAGISEIAEIVNLDVRNFVEIVDFCKKTQIDLVVVGPEEPLVNGLVDILEENNIKAFGPYKKPAQIEASKSFTKEICDEYNIPTAKYKKFDNLLDASNYIDTINAPIVVKADGLAAGKGVIIAGSKEEARKTVTEMFDGKFGDAGKKIVIEEFLTGKEVSFFVITDGVVSKIIGSASDYKRAFDNDMGPNTGGMGTYSPSPLIDKEMEDKIMNQIINPALLGIFNKTGRRYKGVMFAGLMIDKDNNPKLIEFNARFGDPETQSILSRLETDLLAILYACATGKLSEIEIKLSNKSAVTVVMAARGYPDIYQKGTIINLPSKEATKQHNSMILHAGTSINKDGMLCANGGRVLNVVATGKNIDEARNNAYKTIKLIDWQDGFYRNDIALKIDGK